MVMLGLGCNTLGSSSNRLSRRGQVRLVHAAIDLGFTVFDTADAYANGGSELLLGEALRRRHDGLMIATKIGYRFSEPSPGQRHLRRIVARTAGPVRARLRSLRPKSEPLLLRGRGAYSAQSFDSAYLRNAVEGCRRRLRIDEVDVLMLHGPPSIDLSAVETMVGLRDRGWLARIGVGTENEASAREWTGAKGIDVIELGVRVGEAATIARVTEAGVAAWARGVLRGGYMADPPGVAEAVRRLAADAGVEPLDLDLSWVIARASPQVVVVGASSEAHLLDLANRFSAAAVGPDVLDHLENLRRA